MDCSLDSSAPADSPVRTRWTLARLDAMHPWISQSERVLSKFHSIVEATCVLVIGTAFLHCEQWGWKAVMICILWLMLRSTKHVLFVGYINHGLSWRLLTSVSLVPWTFTVDFVRFLVARIKVCVAVGSLMCLRYVIEVSVRWCVYVFCAAADGLCSTTSVRELRTVPR